jgi:hypothetical protein
MPEQQCSDRKFALLEHDWTTLETSQVQEPHRGRSHTQKRLSWSSVDSGAGHGSEALDKRKRQHGARWNTAELEGMVKDMLEPPSDEDEGSGATVNDPVDSGTHYGGC